MIETRNQLAPRNTLKARRFLHFVFWATTFAWISAGVIVPSMATAGEARHANAVGVFHCTFGEDWDVNYDHWPDRWVRATGNDFPHYVKIGIQEDSTAESGKCLRVDLDVAGAAISSPPIREMSRFR